MEWTHDEFKDKFRHEMLGMVGKMYLDIAKFA